MPLFKFDGASFEPLQYGPHIGRGVTSLTVPFPALQQGKINHKPLAKELGIKGHVIVHCESYDMQPTFTAVARYFEILEVALDWLSAHIYLELNY